MLSSKRPPAWRPIFTSAFPRSTCIQGRRGSQPSPSFRRSFMKQSPRKTAEKHLPAACWFYISFSGESDFLGAAFVQARTKPAAIRRTHFLGIYPAGVEDVLCLPITEAEIKKHRSEEGRVGEGGR